jgi:hypothetical protein
MPAARDNAYSLRLNEVERHLLTAAARRLGVTMSEVLRMGGVDRARAILAGNTPHDRPSLRERVIEKAGAET